MLSISSYFTYLLLIRIKYLIILKVLNLINQSTLSKKPKKLYQNLLKMAQSFCSY